MKLFKILYIIGSLTLLNASEVELDQQLNLKYYSSCEEMIKQSEFKNRTRNFKLPPPTVPITNSESEDYSFETVESDQDN